MIAASQMALAQDHSDGVVIVDSAGLVVFANPAAEKLFGRGAASLTGARFGFPLVTGESCDINVVCDGQVKVTEMRAAAIEWDGRPAALASLQDATARRPAQLVPDRRTDPPATVVHQLEPALAREQPGTLSRGRLLAAISTRIVALLRDHYGRGPMKAKTYALDDMVIVVMGGSGLTALEKTIMDNDEPDRVVAMRDDFHRMMTPRFTDTIEELTGRKVVAFLSQTHILADLTIEIFFIDGPLPGETHGSERVAAQPRLTRHPYVPAPPVSAREAHGTIMASLDHVSRPELEQLTAHERTIVDVVAQLLANGESAPLTALLHGGHDGLERVRGALDVLGELDRQLLVQVALDALICAHLDGRGAAERSG
jgi:uncharacterized protein YbcI